MAEIRTKRSVMRRKKRIVGEMFFQLLCIPVLYLLQYLENNNDGTMNIPWWIPVMIVVTSLFRMFKQLRRLEGPDEEKSTQDKVE